MSINPQAKKDIEDLKSKIKDYNLGKIPDERFKAFRLTRGVYGQRQTGVQMLRIKIPYGKINPEQLRTVANLSKQYTNGNLHTTTRQNIQLHYVKLKDSAEMWEKLEEVGLTTKEACGNTVRTITASPFAGLDPEELFDVSPYAHAVSYYFLRNAVCQDMGRKFKMAFSAHDDDSAFTYIHDFGFIPRLKTVDGEEKRGFKVLVGGGLGAQAIMAIKALDFLPEEELIPFIEAGLRVFDRYGERQKRHKARLKYLIEPKKGIGLEKFLELMEEEKKALPNQKISIDTTSEKWTYTNHKKTVFKSEVEDQKQFDLWLKENTFKQKQEGFTTVKVRLLLGNIDSETSIKLANLAEEIGVEDMRVTINQGLLLRFVPTENLAYVFNKLNELGIASTGFDTIADITACPGTDTCNLGVTNSTDVSILIEEFIKENYKENLNAISNLKIKISGCMNSCGQHMIANIGFHGSSIRSKGKVIPALQVVLGGGVNPDGEGFIAEKIIKIPSKRVLGLIKIYLDDYLANSEESEHFNAYVQRNGKMYFYNLAKDLANVTEAKTEEFIDWGQDSDFVPEIGVGECAGVSFDMVATIINDASERIQRAKEGLAEKVYPDAVYNAYSGMVIGAKALLLSKDVNSSTQIKLIKNFDENFCATGEFPSVKNFEELVLQINQNEPEEAFAKSYFKQAENFLKEVIVHRAKDLEDSEDKEVLGDFYKA